MIIELQMILWDFFIQYGHILLIDFLDLQKLRIE